MEKVKYTGDGDCNTRRVRGDFQQLVSAFWGRRCRSMNPGRKTKTKKKNKKR